MVEGQEYAFPIETVEEIVRVPGEINHVPKADGHVLGLINLRSRLLPLVGLREMFRLAKVDIGDDNRIVVVRLSTGAGGRAEERIGIVVDQVREVLRVRAQEQDPVPDLLFGAGDESDFSAICRLENGKRLVSVLSVSAMFDQANITEAIGQAGGGTNGQLEPDPTDEADEDAVSTDAEEDMQVVAFHLANEEFGVDISAVHEIIRVPDQLSRVPKTPSFIEGMVNLRTRLGMAKAKRDDRQRIMVLSIGGVQTGFVVDSVSEVLTFSRLALEPAPEMSVEQSRLMGKVANLKDSGRMLMLIDANCLLEKKEIETLASDT